MFNLNVNKKLITIKLNYFLHLACLGPIIGFLPTIVRQLGYSITTYGIVMTFMSMISMIIAPLSGMFVDKFPVKKVFYFTMTLLMAVFSFLFMFIPKVPLEIGVEMKCESEIIMIVRYDTVQQNMSIFNDKINDELITCKLTCQNTTSYDHQINKSNNQSDFSDNWMTATNNDIENINDRSRIDVTLKLKDMEQDTESSYIFHLLSVQMNGTKIPLTCQCRLKTFCHISCSNEDIMRIATVPTYRGNVFNLYQFWIFFIILFALWCSITITVVLQNPICLDILEDKPEDFGKQKCCASFGWGIFSIFIGWLVDWCSINKKEKDYSSVFYSCIILVICNLFVINKLKVYETKKSKGKLMSIYGLFTKHYVIVFYIWVVSKTFFHAIITHFLFWYMEDLVSANNDHIQRAWLKTLQGLAQGIQCFGGEIPFFALSGWIIRKIGHINCMTVVMGAMAIRMYLYTVIWNPAWIIAIELLNGLSYALGQSAKMSYAKIMSPKDTTSSVIGILGFFECVGKSLGSLIGGYLFDSYGGVWSFRFFAYSSAFMCFLSILSNRFGLSKELMNSNFVAVPTTENDQKK